MVSKMKNFFGIDMESSLKKYNQIVKEVEAEVLIVMQEANKVLKEAENEDMDYYSEYVDLKERYDYLKDLMDFENEYITLNDEAILRNYTMYNEIHIGKDNVFTFVASGEDEIIDYIHYLKQRVYSRYH